MGFVNQKLIQAFHKIGLSVAKRPKYFIIATVILSITLGTGLLRLEVDRDLSTLYIDRNPDSKFEKEIVEAHFPANESNRFTPSRILGLGRFATTIITAKDGDTLLRSSIWNEILEVNSIVTNTSIEWTDKQMYSYIQLCSSWENECFENTFLDLAEIIPEIENGSLRVNYPTMFNPITYAVYVLPLYFGGIQLNNELDTVLGIKAVRLHYAIASDSEEQTLRAEKWENAVLEQLEKATTRLKLIDVLRNTHKSLIEEQEANVEAVRPIFGITVVIMCIFIVLSTLSRDWVKAKPWVALSGIFCAFLGTLGACGALSYAGVPWIQINISIPFIMLGIGIDDTFVMLAVWRQTNPLDPVRTRLAKCYSEAAVSITVTTLTDMLSFYVGLLTPIPSIQYFCAYAGTSVLGIYICQVFCFGAILGISGDQEAGNRHSVFWWLPLTPKSKSGGKSRLHRLFFTGGIDRTDPTNPEDNTQNSVMVFFRDSFSKILFKAWVKILVLLVYIAYVSVSVWGVLQMEEGLTPDRLVREDSYLYEFHLKDAEYFSKYGFRIQVVISTPLDYSNNETQAHVLNTLHKLSTSSPYVTPEFSENWLSSFTSQIARYSELYEYNISTEQSFIDTLRSEFLVSNTFAEDVKFNEDFTKILSTRYIVQTQNISSTAATNELILKLRQVANSEQEFNLTVFSPWFSIKEQNLIIRGLTIQLVSIAAGVVMLVAIAFIPNVLCALVVFFTIVSIELGVLGFMSLWGVNLDMISILDLIMCIGFSVDFSAHVSYTYISSLGSSEERIQKTMFALGLPILQGATSTVIGVVALIFVPSYIFKTFFKVIFLVMLIATWHGLFVLPVLLLVIKPELIMDRFRKEKSDKEQTQMQAHELK